MRNISLSKIVDKKESNYQQENKNLHEELIMKVVEQHTGIKFKEEDFKDCKQVYAEATYSWYRFYYKDIYLGIIREKQSEKSLTLNFNEKWKEK